MPAVSANKHLIKHKMKTASIFGKEKLYANF